MTTDPHSLEEWGTYIETLDAEAVYAKAEGANSVTFVRHLKSEGLSAKEIRGVFEYFVRRLVACEELPPAGGYYDLRKIMDELGLGDP